MSQKYFWELDANTIHRKCILLDIDGTLVYASGSHLHPGVHEMLEKLEKNGNEVVIFSNSLHHGRSVDVAKKLGLPYVQSHFRKPFPQVLKAIPNPKKLPILIIGDLFLTDGLLAFFTGSRYLRVKRFVSDNESRLWHLTLYWVDDLIYSLV